MVRLAFGCLLLQQYQREFVGELPAACAKQQMHALALTVRLHLVFGRPFVLASSALLQEILDPGVIGRPFVLESLEPLFHAASLVAVQLVFSIQPAREPQEWPDYAHAERKHRQVLKALPC